MPSYSNGFIPLTLLITFMRGWNATDGNWHHSLSPATYARHLALVRLAFRRTGRTLAISAGWSAYRPYAAQVLARAIHGIWAALPGTSSHGGFWEGKQTLAMDYGNWAWVYENHGGMAAFFADCRAVGLTPGMIMRSRGYPDEPWHVIDLQPWSAVPAFADAEGFNPSDPNTSPEDDMGTIDNNEANRQVIKNAIFEFLSTVGQIDGENGWKFIREAVWGHPIQAQTAEGQPLVNDAGPVRFNAAGYLASTNARVGGTVAPVEIDEAELAASLAPFLIPLVENMAALSDADVARLAAAAADEQDRRARERLTPKSDA